MPLFPTTVPWCLGSLPPTVDTSHIAPRCHRSSEFVPFPLRADGIDYDELDALARSRRASLVVAGGTSYGLQIDYGRLRQVADHCGAHLHADLAHTAPFVASGRTRRPFPTATPRPRHRGRTSGDRAEGSSSFDKTMPSACGGLSFQRCRHRRVRR